MVSAQRMYTMLGNEALWRTTLLSHEVLKDAAIPYALVGGVAVCLHGYQRNTVDVDILVRREDAEKVKQGLVSAGFEWNATHREFRSPQTVPVHFLLTDDPAGDDRSYGIVMPDPADTKVCTEIEGLAVLSLPRLIEVKLACGLGNLRRTHRDFADIVELIIVHGLSRSYARHLHKSVRKAFRDLVIRARA